jgi:ribonuclease BN (tRNA processing enzyme)
MTKASLRLTVVGPAPAYTRRPDRPSSCYLLRTDGEALVLDMGQGSFAALAGSLDPSTLRAIFISHSHPDHCIDLVPLRHYLRYGMDPPGSVELHAPAELRRRFDQLIGEDDFLADLPGDPLEPGDRLLGPFVVRVARVTHTDSSFAFRVAALEGPGLVYSGDCANESDLLPLIKPGDVLLCEAAFGAGPAAPGAGHLAAAQAAQAAREGGAGRLILTHILDQADEAAAAESAAEVYQGPIDVARPGLVVDLGRGRG